MLEPLHLIFYVFAAVAVCSAIAVISVRNPVQSVLSLVVTFFAMAAIWLLLRAEFLALILVLVYVGAVMTLFLFVVMMLNIDKESKAGGFVRHVYLGLIVMVAIGVLMVTALNAPDFGIPALTSSVTDAVDYSNTEALGTLIFTQFVYPFEIAGVLLLAAIIAAITLAHRKPKGRKIQYPSAQIDVRPEDRVRLVKMPSEPRPSSSGGN